MSGLPGRPHGKHFPGSCAEAAGELLGRLSPIVAAFAFEQRIEGSVKAHEGFDGVLAEHALALEEICEEMRLIVRALLHGDSLAEGRVGAALQRFEHEITYVHALGSVAGPATDQEDETDG